MVIPPQTFTWDAERSVMVPRRTALANRTYVDGEGYRLDITEERSTNTHNHFFASLHEAWVNLPEAVSDRFVNEEHFRKDCLIETGFYNERTFVCTSKAEAIRLTQFLKPTQEYARFVIHGCVVVERTAKSQSVRAMGKDEFNRSKQAVLDYVSSLIGTTPAALQANAARVA